MNNGRLDMRMNQDNPLTAYEVVNTYEQSQLKKSYGNMGKSAGQTESLSLYADSGREAD